MTDTIPTSIPPSFRVDESGPDLRAALAEKVRIPAPAPPPPPVVKVPAPGDVTHVDYEGHKYEINKAGANSLELIEAMQAEDIVGALRIALTPAAYTAMRADLKDPATGFTSIGTFTAFLEVFTTAVRPTEKQQSS